MVSLKWHTTTLWYITAYGGRGLWKRIFIHLYWTKYNEIDICDSDVQKHVSHKKLYKYFAYRVKQSFSYTLWPLKRNILKHTLTHFYCTKYVELNAHHSCEQKHTYNCLNYTTI